MVTHPSHFFHQEWALTTDFTCKVERMDYSVSAVSAICWKRVEKSWVRSPLPLALAIHPGSEDSSSYQHILECLKLELERRRMILPKQLNVDWFPGFTRLFRDLYCGYCTHGIEHARRAMDRNHSAGYGHARGVRRRKPRPVWWIPVSKKINYLSYFRTVEQHVLF